MNLTDASTDELLDEFARLNQDIARVREELTRRTTNPGPGPGRGRTADIEADVVERLNAERRAHWARSKAQWRAGQRAKKSAPVSAVSASDTPDTSASVVVVGTEEQQQHRTEGPVRDKTRVRETADTADQIPGLGHFGPTPEPAAPAPDDIARRRLRTGVAEILARAELERQRATKTITNPGGWLRAVAATIATDQADEISTAVETALTRWPNPTPTHVASLLATTPAPSGRRAIPHVPVNLPAPQPPERSLEALAAARAALRKAAS